MNTLTIKKYNKEDLWKEILDNARTKIKEPVSFDKWVEGTKIKTVKNHCLFIWVKSELQGDWLTKNYRVLLSRISGKILNDVVKEIRFVIDNGSIFFRNEHIHIDMNIGKELCPSKIDKMKLKLERKQRKREREMDKVKELREAGERAKQMLLEEAKRNKERKERKTLIEKRLKECLDTLGLSLDDVLGRYRKPYLVRARVVIANVLYSYGYTHEEIAEVLKKNRTNIIYYLKKDS